MAPGAKFLIIAILLCSLVGCRSEPQSIFEHEAVQDKRKKLMILTPPVPCRNCILYTLKICRDNLNPLDYVIISSEHFSFFREGEQLVEVSEETYDRSLENDYHVHVRLDFGNESRTLTMNNMEAYKELRTRIIQGKEEGVFD